MTGSRLSQMGCDSRVFFKLLGLFLILNISLVGSGFAQCPDADGDGYEDSLCGGSDCNDNDVTINPGAFEMCNGIDNDCDLIQDNGVCTISFSDVTSTHWGYQYVDFLFNNGVINGYPDGTFKPADPVTRAQILKMVVNGNNIPQYLPDTPTFPDVPPTHWAYGYVEAAVQAGIIGGYPDGTFKPGDFVTRGQLSKMIAGSKGWSYSGGLQDFTDVPSTHWSYEYVMTMKEKGVVNGYPDGTFRPGDQVTRAQTSKMIAVMMQNPSIIDYPVIRISRPKALDSSLKEHAPGPGDDVNIRVNITHGKGISYIDSVLITIKYPNLTSVITNGSMSLISVSSIINTYEYVYTLPNNADSLDKWSIRIFANDTDGEFAYKSSTFLAINFSAKNIWIKAKPAEAMVSPKNWLGDPTSCNPQTTQSPLNFRTIEITATPLAPNGYYLKNIGPLDARIFNISGDIVGSVTLTGDGPYSGSVIMPDSTRMGEYYMKVIDHPEIMGTFSVMEWRCFKCHMKPQPPSTFDMTTVHNIHKNTRYGNGDGCDHSQGYYGKYCSECHFNYATGCEECHNDYTTGLPMQSPEFGEDIHYGVLGCTQCHGSVSSLIASPVCDNPACHPRPESELTQIPSTSNDMTHNVPQDVSCGACHTNNHDIQRMYDQYGCVDCHGEHCHVGVVYCTVCHSEEVHSQRYINKTGWPIYKRYDPIKAVTDPLRYSTNTTEVSGNCRTCHDPVNYFDRVIISDGAVGEYDGTITGRNGPAIIDYIGHGSGAKWGDYWDNSTPAQACWFCHQESCLVQFPYPGKAFKAAGGFNFSMPAWNLSGYRDPLNVPLTYTNTTWCGSCHYVNDEDYDITIGYLSNVTDGSDWIPPEITSNHNLAEYTDYNCFSCHAGANLTRETATMDIFMHNIGITGGGGPDCYSCHNKDKSLAKVDMDSMNSSLYVHRNLNNQTAMNQTTNELNKVCWGCHQSDGSEPGAHPDRFNNPFTCTDCHGGSPPAQASDALQVREHFRSGEDVFAANASSDSESCLVCHGLSEMLLSYTEPGEFTNFSIVSHYARTRPDLQVGSPVISNCSYCHQNPGNPFEAIMENPAVSNYGDHNRNDPTYPYCNDCHGTGRIHDEPLYVDYSWNLCCNCHPYC